MFYFCKVIYYVFVEYFLKRNRLKCTKNLKRYLIQKV
nr:MAG TPA: hypothetical protein [Caudoviricetes sp.]